MNLNPKLKLVLFATSLIVYIHVFITFINLLGIANMLASSGLIPIILGGWFWGRKGGILSSMLVISLSILLLLLLSEPVLANIVGRWPGSLAKIVLGFATGYFSELFHKVKEQAIQLNEEKQKLQKTLIEKNKSEKQIYNLEKKHQNIVENLREVVFQKDYEGKFFFLNASWQVLTGLKIDESIGQNYLEFVHLEDREKAAHYTEQLNKGNSKFCFYEIRLLTNNNKYKWVEVFEKTILDYENNFVGTSGTLTDITERKLHEEKIAESERMLRRKFELIEFISKTSSRLINIDVKNIDKAITEALEQINKFSDLEGGYVYLISDDGKFIYLSHESISDNSLHSFKIEYGEYSIEEISDFIKELRKGRIYSQTISSAKNNNNQKLMNVMTKLGIKSLINVPLTVSDKLLGFIGFVSTKKEMKWPVEIISTFQLPSQMIANALERKNYEEKIIRQYEEIKEKGFELRSMNVELLSANDELVKISHELMESEEKFRELAENINAVFWLWVPGKIIYVSRGYEKIWGKSRESLYKNYKSFVYSIHPDEKKKMIKMFLTHSYEKGEVFQEEFRILQPDGNTKWIQAKAFPIRNNKEGLKVAGIAEDITFSKKAEEETLNALRRSQELNELKSKFVSMVSHEFRTPLSTILSSAELLHYFEERLKNEDKKKHVDKIVSSVDYLTELLDDVITINKADSNTMKVNLEEVNLYKLAKRIIDDVKIGFQEIPQVNIKDSSENAIIKSDSKLLTQIISNLVSNAIKYTPSEKNVTVEIDKNNKNVFIKVIDEGIGIPEESRKNIFTPFFRAGNIGNKKGSGLGLAIAKNSVEMLEGEITYTSILNKGTIFNVMLPNEGVKSEKNCNS